METTPTTTGTVYTRSLKPTMQLRLTRCTDIAECAEMIAKYAAYANCRQPQR